MPKYVVMFPADDEADWEARTEADRQANFDSDFEFGQLLKKHGGAVTGGEALVKSDEARTIMRGPDSHPQLAEGPFRKGAEQLSGFFIVTCDDYDTLVDAARLLVRTHPVVEIRPVKEF
ncbi:YciI family protein [Xylanimonas sp. McL0601]|uniref:YciI family protein n=1 Tax=Xylanimonas sp. McL0601 TaxID=3414739 RepID=UPI003CF59D98